MLAQNQDVSIDQSCQGELNAHLNSLFKRNIKLINHESYVHEYKVVILLRITHIQAKLVRDLEVVLLFL